MKLLLFILLCFFSISSTEELRGKVVKVSDGDTITILTRDNKQVKIRLDGIDCPEKSQDFGRKATEFTASLCAGKQVKIIAREKDRYGRILGFVIVGDKNVNKELLKAGYAWHYKQYNKDKELSALEVEARQKKVGLWAQKNPVAPWEYRKIQKTQKIKK